MKERIENYIIKENWDGFTASEHDLWNKLYQRQIEILPTHVCPEFLEGIKLLRIQDQGIPKFDDISKILQEKTGWTIVGVPGLVPDDIFFELLSQKLFPSTSFLRTPEQFNYIQEPDVFHDIFGHVPLLILPAFANYMEAYGKIALKAPKEAIHHFARLYWYTVEFGLIKNHHHGLKTYGAGIVSSYKETRYCVEDPHPKRLSFDIERIMSTDYKIDDLQEIYFVIESYDQLFESLTQDLHPLYEKLKGKESFVPGVILPGEENIALG